MVYIFKSDQKKYIPKKLIKGSAIYLPSKRKYGDGFGDVIGWLSSNADTIKNVGSTAASVIDSGSKIANSVIGTIKNVKELNKIKEERMKEEEAARKILSGSGFFVVNK
jgi:hypothetical protein